MSEQSLTQLEKQKATELSRQQTRIATDLKDTDLTAESRRFFDLEETKKENAFIKKIANSEELEPEERNRLLNIQERNMSHLLLNTSRFGGDSGLMKDVKARVRWLEVTLATKSLEESTLKDTQDAYDKAIESCLAYVRKKHPRFSPGKSRKKKVKERLAKLELERSAFERARVLVNQGKLDAASLSKPADLIVSYRNWESQGNKMVDRTGVIGRREIKDKKVLLTQKKTHEVNKKDTFMQPQFDPDSVVLSKHQKKFKIGSVRGAISKLLGKDRYSGYDQTVSMKNETQTEVKLHHALGTKEVEKGERVVQIDCAGSTFKQFRSEHKGYQGKHNKQITQGFIDTFGTDYKTGEASMKGILAKEKYFEEQDITVPRYTIEGPGLLEITSKKFNMDTVSDHVFELVTGHIERIMAEDKWKAHPCNININIQGHSRGAIGETMGIKRVLKWLDEKFPYYMEGNPRQYVKIHMLEFDPVAGGDVFRDKYKKHDLRDKDGRPQEGLNTTTVYSMHTEHEKGFTPARIRGQQRIILMADKHTVGLDSIDTSQREVQGDQKFHRPPVFDSKTGEAYRSSGFSEMPNGIFIRDENGAVVRMRSYAEAERVLKAVWQDTSGQEDRHEVILQAIKEWFIDNEYVDETMTKDEVHDMGIMLRDRDDANSAFSVIYNTENNKDMELVKEAVTKVEYEHVFEKEINVETGVKFYDAIDACRNYLENHKPSSEAERKRIAAVSEVLSLYRAEYKIFMGQM